jgi:hypothetical protein
MMSRVASWLNQQYPKELPISDDSRKDRGIHHAITGMLLCPIRYDWADEEYVFLLSLSSITHPCATAFATNFGRLLQAMIIPSISAFVPSTVALRAQSISRKKAFCRVPCLLRYATIPTIFKANVHFVDVQAHFHIALICTRRFCVGERR